METEIVDAILQIEAAIRHLTFCLSLTGLAIVISLGAIMFKIKN